MRRLTDGSRFARRALIGDLAALLVFLVIGFERHAENVGGRFASLAVIFAAAWIFAAWALGTYRPPTTSGLILNVVLAVPLAVVTRAAVVRVWSTTDVLTFMAAAVALCAAFAALARLLVLYAERRST